MSEGALVAFLALSLGIERAGLGADLFTIDTAQMGRPPNVPVCRLLAKVLRPARWVNAFCLSVSVLVVAVTAALATVITVLIVIRVLLLALVRHLPCS